MSNSGSGVTWGSLLSEKKDDIQKCLGQGYRLPENIRDGRSFRAAFEDLCRPKVEYRVSRSRLEARLIPSYTPITELAKAVDRSAPNLQDSPFNDTLEDVIWRLAFALIEVNGPASRLDMADHSIVRVQS